MTYIAGTVQLPASGRTGGGSFFMRLSLVAGLFLCGALSIYGQAPAGGATRSPRHLSLEDAVEMTINNNLNLEAARIVLDIKKRRSDLVWNEFLPTLMATGTLSGGN